MLPLRVKVVGLASTRLKEAAQVASPAMLASSSTLNAPLHAKYVSQGSLPLLLGNLLVKTVDWEAFKFLLARGTAPSARLGDSATLKGRRFAKLALLGDLLRY